MKFRTKRADEPVWFTGVDVGGSGDLALVPEGQEPEPGEDFVRVRVAMHENAEYNAELDRLRKPLRKQIARGSISTEKQTDLTCRAMARAILHDIQGAIGPDGKELKNTEENRYILLRCNPNFRAFVASCAMESARFQAEGIEADAGK